jgi:hypothetical protein
VILLKYALFFSQLSDCLNFDPQNVPSAHNLCSEENTDFLDQLDRQNTNGMTPFVGLSTYLTIVRLTILPWVSFSLAYTIQNRISDISYATLSMRNMRVTIQSQEKKTGIGLDRGHITQNSYENMEMNFTAFISIVQYCRDHSQLFYPQDENSQFDERHFRTIRSYSQVGSTCVKVTSEQYLQKSSAAQSDEKFKADNSIAHHSKHKHSLQNPPSEV